MFGGTGKSACAARQAAMRSVGRACSGLVVAPVRTAGGGRLVPVNLRAAFSLPGSKPVAALGPRLMSPFLPVRCMSTIPAADAALASSKVISVKVGDSGRYAVFKHDEVLKMSRSDLLKALIADHMFGRDLTDANLGKCRVSIFKLTSDGPSEFALKGAKTVGEILPRSTSSDDLCIRVHLPMPTSARAMPAVAAAPVKALNSARKFAVSGGIHPIFGNHYFRLRPDTSVLVKHFDDREFFILYGPHGSGKTTIALHALAAARERGWYCLQVDISGLSHTDVDSFWRELGHRVSNSAAEWGLKLEPITSASTFQSAFSRSVLGATKVVLMLDGFDELSRAVPDAKDSFLGTIRAMKQNAGVSSAMQCIFAVGTSNTLSIAGQAGSPFSSHLPAPFLSEQQVMELLSQFTSARGLVLEDGIAADIHRLTAGHAELVCACGEALDTAEKVERQAGRISVAAWRAYSAQRLKDDIKNRAVVARMVDTFNRLPAESRRLLESAVFQGISTLRLSGRPNEVIEGARRLAAEGWLIPEGGVSAETFAVTSPLVGSLALDALMELKLRAMQIKDPLPLVDGVLDFGAVVAAALPAFDGTVMREAPTLAAKQSRATLPGVPSRQPVPKETIYQSQFFAITRQWFSVMNHADLYDQADVDGAGEKETADILVVGRPQAGDKATTKHIVELVASNNSDAIQKRYARTISYMATHKTDRGTCITFTALRKASDVDTVVDTQLVWPSAAQFSEGLSAVHVLHDLAWTRAAVFTRQHGRAPRKVTVPLPAATPLTE